MPEEDIYKTIEQQGEAIYTEKRSKFLAFAIPVTAIEQVKEHIETYQKKYYDARHVCYAYRLGERGDQERANAQNKHIPRRGEFGNVSKS